MWDPAHGKPYASAQLELSFGVGVGGLRPVPVQAQQRRSPGVLNDIRITFMESSVEKHAVLDDASRDTNVEVKGQQDLLTLTSPLVLHENQMLCNILQRNISLLSGWLS